MKSIKEIFVKTVAVSSNPTLYFKKARRNIGIAWRIIEEAKLQLSKTTKTSAS